ncbi:hypothetical protein DSAG12_03896 [Promethearchaeum syntrophicum]|uniref:Uncharacterized protein n=1 Tax=Promethearchaeum syntrophicum TaxID=2594042 RepID=A0A5B9DFJ8_9ARCH|nr:hypothetical protein [Candidatus Prometheoarchaeum syntrophicum]QEE18058.1 hypothetical protein DSAG12_03896 [Candidatus Prometheoarchaeum syntrophicum]
MIVDPVRVWLIIPKMFVAMMFLFFAFRIKRESNYLLNKIFFFAFLSWAIFSTFDSFSFTFAPASYTSFLICSVLWAIQKVMLNLYSGLVYNASNIITHGELRVKKKKYQFVEITLLLISTVLMIIEAPLQVLDENKDVIDPKTLPPSGVFTSAEGFSVISAIASAIPFIFYIIATVNLSKTIKKTEDRVSKKKMLGLVIGIDLIPIGLLYFMFKSLLFQTYSLWTSMIGQIFLFVSPILIFWALHKEE